MMRRWIVTVLVVMMLSMALVGCSDKAARLGATQTFAVQDTLDSVEGVSVRVILLLGQSNATGVARNEYLSASAPEVYRRAAVGYDNVWINYITENGSNCSQGQFVPVRLGQGAGPDYFGPEVGMAEVLSAQYPQETVIILKYSWGGSVLWNQWLDGRHGRGELYRAAYNFASSSLAYLESKGYVPQLTAVCWMQGESDAVNLTSAKDYYRNTKRLVTYLRQDWACYTTDFCFVDAGIAEIDLWQNPLVVNAAKEKWAAEDPYGVYFSTEAMGLTTDREPDGAPDLAHYDADSMLALGRQFARCIIQ